MAVVTVEFYPSLAQPSCAVSGVKNDRVYKLTGATAGNSAEFNTGKIFHVFCFRRAHLIGLS